jgi:hypothetical protein
VADSRTQAREQARIGFPSFNRCSHQPENPTIAAANPGSVRQFWSYDII